MYSITHLPVSVDFVVWQGRDQSFVDIEYPCIFTIRRKIQRVGQVKNTLLRRSMNVGAVLKWTGHVITDLIGAFFRDILKTSDVIHLNVEHPSLAKVLKIEVHDIIITQTSFFRWPSKLF